MSVMVYPLLGELLRGRNMTVADLESDALTQKCTSHGGKGSSCTCL